MRRRRTSLNLQRYVPGYVARIANRWARSSSRIYRAKFGVGINEWRVMARLAVEAPISANRICTELGLDKAAVSRSIKALERRKHIRLIPDRADARRRLIILTAKGLRLHDKILKIALRRERQMLATLSSAEIDSVVRLLSRIHQNMFAMRDDEG